MSLINDALNKVQRQRLMTSAEAAARGGAASAAAQPKSPGKIPPLVWVLINAGVLILVLAGNRFLFNAAPSAEPSSASSSATPTVTASAPIVRPTEPNVAPAIQLPPPVAATANAKNNSSAPAPTSPFIAAASSTSSPPPLDSEYDLAGMTVMGKDTLLSISRRSDQRSFWVPVGKTVGEVTAVSYNADRDDAQIRVRGQLVTIGMRNASVYFHPVGTAK